MIAFNATYFDGKSSRSWPVVITFSGTLLHIEGENGVPDLRVSLRDCGISPPLGRTSRSILLPGGALCETGDLKAMEELDVQLGSNSGIRLVHFLETRWKMVALSFLGLIAAVWAFSVFGIPALSKKIAYAVPPKLAAEIGRHTLKVLDGRFLQPTKLNKARRERLKEAFTRLRKDAGGPFKYNLLFRKSPVLGPNAFALPSGEIIITDELVRIAKKRRELEGVFLHEIAHVEKRHALRMIIQDAGVFLIISTLVGDITSVSSVAGSLPTVLAQSGYSRQFEREADESAARYFISRGRSVKPIQDILMRMSRGRGNFSAGSLLSTHPLTKERVEYLKAMEKRLKK